MHNFLLGNQQCYLTEHNLDNKASGKLSAILMQFIIEIVTDNFSRQAHILGKIMVKIRQ